MMSNFCFGRSPKQCLKNGGVGQRWLLLSGVMDNDGGSQPLNL